MHESYSSSLFKIQIKSETRPFLPKWRDAQPKLLGWRWYLPKVSHEFQRPYTVLSFIWLCWVLIAFHCGKWRPLSRSGVWASRCTGFSCGAWVLGCEGVGGSLQLPGCSTGSVVVAHRLSCSAACGVLLDQGLNLYLLHWQADSLPLSHQGSPTIQFWHSLSVSWLLPVLVATDSLFKSVWSILKASWTQQTFIQVLSWGFGLPFQVPSRKALGHPVYLLIWRELNPLSSPCHLLSLLTSR